MNKFGGKRKHTQLSVIQKGIRINRFVTNFCFLDKRILKRILFEIGKNAYLKVDTPFNRHFCFHRHSLSNISYGS